MGILSGIFRSRDKPTDRTAGSAYSFFLGGTAAGKYVTERSAMQMTAVYCCVRILSEAVASLPLQFYRYTLVLVPAQIYVRRIIRHKLVLKSNLQIKDPERKPFELAPLPVMPLPKCMASESLLTDIILQKFLYHMPFYRVIQKYKELGVKISDSTMNDWYAAACEKLKLLYDILLREVLSSDYISGDRRFHNEACL